VNTLRRSGSVVIASVGNEGEDGILCPAAFREVIAVGAVDFEGKAQGFSSFGEYENVPKPDIFGYGCDVQVAAPRSSSGDSRYVKITGTSIATAYVAGIAALYNTSEDLVGDALMKRLFETAVPIDGDMHGRGIARFVDTHGM
ncbi:MAG: peptidase and in kexin sedolisin, partial [Microvirga sp.]|nr:peptidase and in kexin sedolisin [Microvirga sp.]